MEISPRIPPTKLKKENGDIRPSYDAAERGHQFPIHRVMREHNMRHNPVGYVQPYLAGAQAPRPAVGEQIEDTHAVLTYLQHS
jgi:hypothetical protein